MPTKYLFPELIRTKLHRPPFTGPLVARSRLLDLMDRSLTTPVTIVCAPAGFGKTTLVSSWIEAVPSRPATSAQPMRTAWLSLEASDGDVLTFLRYLVAAIRTAFPNTCADVVRLLKAPSPPTLDRLMVALINELEHLESPLLLVIEDCHLVSDEPAGQVIHEISEHCPPALHLILTSRTTPPIPLAQLRARGLVTEVRARNLRFTPDEATAFLNYALETPLSTPALNILIERTEGWIAGLHLAGLSLASTDDVEGAVAKLGGTNTYIADYLMDEVLARQSPEVQRFLHATSITERFCTDLAHHLLDSSIQDAPAQSAIQTIISANLFLLPLDQSATWFRYHALFREMLLSRLQAVSTPDTVCALHLRCARWFAENGSVDEALRHALAASDFNLAAEVMEANLVDVLNRGDRVTLERWLRLLPEPVIEQRVGLMLIRLWVLVLEWQLKAQAGVIQRIEHLIAEGGEPTLSPAAQGLVQGQLAAVRAQWAYFGNQPEETITRSSEVFDLLPAEWMYVRGGAALYLGLGMQACGRSAEAIQWLTEHYAMSADKSNGYAIRLLWSLCFVAYMNADLRTLRQQADFLLGQSEAAQLPSLLAWAHYFIGFVDYAWNNLESARRHFDSVVSQRDSVQALAAKASYAGLVLTLLAVEEVELAAQSVNDLASFERAQNGVEDPRTHSLRARVELAKGQIVRAANWADSLIVLPPQQPLMWPAEAPLTMARAWLARNGDQDRECNRQLLAALYDHAATFFNVRLQIETLALRAVAWEVTAEEQALQDLRQALAMAEPGEDIRVFLDLGTPMQRLLQQLADTDRADGFVHNVLNAFPGREMLYHEPNPTAGMIEGETIEHLTPRELEILGYMRMRLTDKEIASRLVISIVTVKRHATNIYVKLGVNRRWDAVAKAERLGLLPHD